MPRTNTPRYALTNVASLWSNASPRPPQLGRLNPCIRLTKTEGGAANGLSPWGLGPAYIIHDWIFEVHRCRRPAPAEIQNITFEQSALILAEVARALVDAGLVDGRFVDEIVWAVGSPIARSLWDRSPTAAECAVPRPLRSAVPGTLRRAVPGRIIADFIIPGPRRR
jgi:hypothetical protein